MGEGATGEVVLDSTAGGATLVVLCAGRVVLQSLDVRKTSGAAVTHALWILSGQVQPPIRSHLFLTQPASC